MMPTEEGREERGGEGRGGEERVVWVSSYSMCIEVHSYCYSHPSIRTVWWGQWQGIRVVGPVHSVCNAHFMYTRKYICIYMYIDIYVLY